MAAPLVTVVIPCRDRGRVLEDSVDSVFAQTHDAWELIVVDDGSTDAFTRRVLAAFDWPRSTVLRREGGPGASARTLALEQARGTYVCCLDAGDRMAPTYLERAVAALERAPAAAFASAAWSTSGALEIEVRPTDAGTASLLAGVLHPAGLVRREAARAGGGYDGALSGHEDHDLWLRLAESGGRGVLIDELLLVRRCDPPSSGEGAAAHLFVAGAYLHKHAALLAGQAAEVLGRREALLASLWAARAAPASMDAAAVPSERAFHRIDELEAALADARFQVAHLRASLSWRVTAPLRFLHRQLTRGRTARATTPPPAPARSER
jgi:hypothetical protein